jgi:hypothetical protein
MGEIMNQLYIDCCGYAAINLIESVNGSVKFRGKFQEANAVNKNKRMYTYEVLASNVDKLDETIKARGLYGELDHPTDSIIHLANASHIVTKLWWDGNVLMGEGEILPTPSGMILKKFIESGCRVGISSRGVGNGQTNNEGVLVIGESYKLITFDCVADPSTYAAFQAKFSGKHETFEPVVEQKQMNHRAMVSYFGLTLENKKADIINNIRNK